MLLAIAIRLLFYKSVHHFLPPFAVNNSNYSRKPLTARSIEDAMSNTIPPRSHVDRNMAGEEDSLPHDILLHEHDLAGGPPFTVSTANQHFDRFDASNERLEPANSLEDLTSQCMAPP